MSSTIPVHKGQALGHFGHSSMDDLLVQVVPYLDNGGLEVINTGMLDLLNLTRHYSLNGIIHGIQVR